MEIYKELEALGFFKWYCTQYGSLVYQEYKPVYDDLPLDNIIRTELNACVFKFFRENHKELIFFIKEEDFRGGFYEYDIKNVLGVSGFKTHEEAEFRCLEKLIEIVKKQTV